LEPMRIERRVDRGLPHYTEDDEFTLGGGDVLLPVGGGRYRPRTDTQSWHIARLPGNDPGRGWRIRDLIPHIATWQDRAARAARKVLTEGIQPKPDDRVRTFIGLTDTVEDMNDVTFNAWRARPTADLLSEFQTKHAEMMTALAGLTPGQFMGGDSIEEVFMAFRIPGWQHVRIHRDHVEAALTKEGSTR